MDRPARVQIEKRVLLQDAETRDLERQQDQLPVAVLNTWYGKWAGGAKQINKFRSPYRCNIERDTGYTKSAGPYCCLWFARGACYKGSDCTALHRLPRLSDAGSNNQTTDCFGRTKHSSYREDMAGVGSLFSTNKTLFVGYFGLESGRSKERLSTKILQQFKEWGNVEKVRLGKGSSIAFVTFESEANAQFAKEAMSNQTITGSEILVVRWSRDKPNSRNQGHEDALTPEEERRLRKIVRTVVETQREARKREEFRLTKRTAANAIPGILSDNAAAKLKLLKKRRLDGSRLPHDQIDQSGGAKHVVSEEGEDEEEHSEIDDFEEVSSSTGGLVAYD